MRRALLLATLLAPALAAAQASGQILLNNGRAFPNYVNAGECAGTTIDVKWTAALIQGATGFPNGGTYALYASNQAPPGASASVGTNPCFASDNSTTGLKAFQAGSNTTATGLTADVVVSGGQLVSNGSGDVIADCASTADQTIYLCVAGMNGGTFFGFATATIIISTGKPPRPVITGATPGNGALNMAWDVGTTTTTTSAATQEYAFDATPLTSGDTVVHTSRRTGSSPFRFDGLVNDVVYSVRAFAFSKADTMSDPSDVVTAMPEAVLDFWNAYKGAGGSEAGGCSSGLAGPIGLGVLIATLALVRRRK